MTGILDLGSKRVDDFKAYAHFLESCCFHETDWPIDNIDVVFAWIESENDGPAGGALVRFKDGRYGTFTESQDYTGHG